MQSAGVILRRAPAVVFVPFAGNAALVVVGLFVRPKAVGPFLCAIAAAVMLTYLYGALASGVIRVRSQEYSLKRNRRSFWVAVIMVSFYYAMFTFAECVFIWSEKA